MENGQHSVVVPEKKQKVGGIPGWIFGIMFVLASLGSLTSSILSAGIFLITGLFLLPPIRRIIEAKIKFHFHSVLVFFIGFAGMMIAGLIFPDTSSKETDSEKNMTIVSTDVVVNTNTAQQLTPEEQAAEAAAEKAQQEALAKPHFDDGTYVVGTDIQPGTYRTRKSSSGCYYARLSGFGGSLDEIISNDNTDEPAVITIAETDKGFKSNRCGTWTQDLSAITIDQTTFTDGTYIIGTDIKAGTYKNDGTDSCYYARLSGFSGSFDDLIANENTDDAAIVTIAATDKGFRSNRCGTWTKQ